MTPLPIRDRFRRLRRTEALRLGLRVDVEASEHTVEGLVQALRRRHQNKHLRLGKR
jgi:hypothetical protein